MYLNVLNVYTESCRKIQDTYRNIIIRAELLKSRGLAELRVFNLRVSVTNPLSCERREQADVLMEQI
jgi:hypothetical protein